MYFLRKVFYAMLVVLGVVMLVFVMFQAFGDPARLIVGQTGDNKTMDNIRKDLHLEQPKWQQFLYYLNDLSPIALHTKEDIKTKALHGYFFATCLLYTSVPG